jgi:hypothetical protein
MTSEEQANGASGERLTAAALRQSIVEKEAAKADEALKKRAEADQGLQSLFRDFLEGEMTQQVIDDIRQKILRATERSELEVQVLQFPAKLCTDNGRAINNLEAEWPSTLQGKAKSFYDVFVERGRPQGFKLKALILDFPDGIPGDVGLIVSWVES